ncbi:SdpI family protein [Candidatus Woesearchaeota archaeon]|nr:SdpI family protein [Candidatus Woesearchaeota archaeon]
MRKTSIAMIIMIIIPFIAGIIIYPKMPDQVASHWNTQGEVNGYMSKFWGLFLMPFVSLALFILFLILPMIDPLKNNIKKFRSYFDAFILLMIIFMAYIYALTIMANLGKEFNMTLAMIPALAILFYFTGILLEKSKRNWFIGIRTPWTLSSDKVWDKTHRLGAILFKISAVIILTALVFPDYVVWLILVPILASAIIPLVYSYIIYPKQ